MVKVCSDFGSTSSRLYFLTEGDGIEDKLHRRHKYIRKSEFVTVIFMSSANENVVEIVHAVETFIKQPNYCSQWVAVATYRR